MANADNLLLFSRGDAVSVHTLTTALQEFSVTSGLQINRHKSSIYLVGINDTTQTQLLSIIGFQEGFMSFIYLGIPMAVERL